MQYCLRYAKSSKFKNSSDEIIIIYEKNQFIEFTDFIKEHFNQRIILSISNIKSYIESNEHKKFILLKEKFPNLQIAFCFEKLQPTKEISHELIPILKELKEKEIDYFMGYTVNTGDQLNYLLDNGVSDVYLVEDICFNLQQARELCNKYGVKIRVFPNVAQSSIGPSPALKKFFIRPEDLKFYENYIDVIEFWGELERQDTYYTIYTKGKWMGDLKDIIIGLEESIDSARILPLFAESRIFCRKKCSYGKKCKICDSILSISNTLKDRNFIFKTLK